MSLGALYNTGKRLCVGWIDEIIRLQSHYDSVTFL